MLSQDRLHWVTAVDCNDGVTKVVKRWHRSIAKTGLSVVAIVGSSESASDDARLLTRRLDYFCEPRPVKLFVLTDSQDVDATFRQRDLFEGGITALQVVLVDKPAIASSFWAMVPALSATPAEFLVVQQHNEGVARAMPLSPATIARWSSTGVDVIPAQPISISYVR